MQYASTFLRRHLVALPYIISHYSLYHVVILVSGNTFWFHLSYKAEVLDHRIHNSIILRVFVVKQFQLCFPFLAGLPPPLLRPPSAPGETWICRRRRRGRTSRYDRGVRHTQGAGENRFFCTIVNYNFLHFLMLLFVAVAAAFAGAYSTIACAAVAAVAVAAFVVVIVVVLRKSRTEPCSCCRCCRCCFHPTVTAAVILFSLLLLLLCCCCCSFCFFSWCYFCCCCCCCCDHSKFQDPSYIILEFMCGLSCHRTSSVFAPSSPPASLAPPGGSLSHPGQTASRYSRFTGRWTRWDRIQNLRVNDM